jgi:hypothetical protein
VIRCIFERQIFWVLLGMGVLVTDADPLPTLTRLALPLMALIF